MKCILFAYSDLFLTALNRTCFQSEYAQDCSLNVASHLVAAV